MATVHPSRMGLVPQDPKYDHRDVRRPRSPSLSDRNPRETQDVRDKENNDDSDRRRGRNRERERDRERSNDRYERRRDRDDDRTSPRRRDDGYDRDRDRSRSRRRRSPEYGDYKRPASPAPGPGSEPRMYPNRPPRDGMYERRGGYGGGGSDYLEGRRAQREGSMFSIWPSSPKAPVRALSPEHGSSRRKSKRDRSETPTESSDSESERRRREHKERKRARKEKERRERRARKERKRRPRSHDSEEEERHRHRRSKSKSRPRSPSPSPTPSSTRMSNGEEEWVEKPAAAAPFVVAPQRNGSMPPPATLPTYTKQVDESDDDSDMDVGPQPLMKVTTKKVDERAYGGALLRGEGSAMAAFLQDDTQTRIPRRGEIGLTSDEIALFESVGYVMSGSRHKRMNAVRMRKENQVISAEEKRGILKLQKEERERREAILREEFSELIQEKLKAPETKRTVT